MNKIQNFLSTMKISFTVIKPEQKPDVRSYDSTSLEFGLIELAKELKASIATDRIVYSPNGTMGLKSTLFYGNDVKESVRILVKFE